MFSRSIINAQEAKNMYKLKGLEANVLSGEIKKSLLEREDSAIAVSSHGE